MYQVQQEQQQSPIKVTGSCFRCNKPGHWARSCPESPLNRSPISPQPVVVTSDEEFPAIHCRCGSGFCEIKISNSARNPNRKYYRCAGKYSRHCGYFKWCDQLKKEEIRTVQPEAFPICACGAGVCSIKVEESGVNAGRSYFVCPIRKGDGACNFRQWLGDSPDSTVIPEGPISDQTSDCAFYEFDLNYEADMQVDALQMVAREDPVEENQEIQVHMQDEEDETVGQDCGANETPRQTPEAHPHVGNNNISDSLYPYLTMQGRDAMENHLHDFQLNKVQGSVATLNRTVSEDPSVDTILKYLMAYLPKQPEGLCQIASLYPQGVTIAAVTSLLRCSFPNFNPTPGNNVSISSVKPNNLYSHLDAQPWTGLLLNASTILEHGDEGSIMTGIIVEAFGKLAHQLKNGLVDLLESMSPQNHESMRKEADSTFAALDRLQVDYGLFQLRVDEYIKQAASVYNIEQMINNDASAQELVNLHDNEQHRFDEIFKAYCDAKDAFMESNKQLSILCERASCLNDSSVDLGKALSSCQAENGTLRDNLLQITKTMAECKESLQAASLKATAALKNSEKWKIELSAAKASFQKARAELCD